VKKHSHTTIAVHKKNFVPQNAREGTECRSVTGGRQKNIELGSKGEENPGNEKINI
jgi:hypothetical protein